MKRRIIPLLLLAALVAAFLVAMPSASADTITRRVVEDTYLNGSTTTTKKTNYCNTHPLLFNHNNKFALLTFDTTIPAGHTLTSATLKLDFWDASSGTVQIYKRTAAANCSVTWNSAGVGTWTWPAADLLGSRVGTTSGAGYDNITLDPAKLNLAGQTHLAVKMVSSVGFDVKFNADETGGADYPQLVLVTAPTATTTTVAPTTTTTPPPSGRADLAGVAIPENRLLADTQVQLDADMAKIVETGAKWLRFDVAAVNHEQTQGNTNWAGVDRIMNSADAHNLKVLGACTTLPTWVRPAGTPWNYGPTTAAQRSAFADFCTRGAQRYVGRMDAWELWNEPNLDQFWSPTPSASNYKLLIEATYGSVKAASGVPVIAGGTGWAGGTPDIDSVVWYQNLYAAGGKPFFDAATTHPYPDLAGIAWGETAKSVQVRQTMNANGDSAKQLWGTETGAPTGGSGSTTEAGQANLLTATYDLWIGSQIIPAGPLFTYTLRDTGGTDREGYFGIIRTDGTSKPAFTALQQWIVAG